jgi:hypothetical protein
MVSSYNNVNKSSYIYRYSNKIALPLGILSNFKQYIFRIIFNADNPSNSGREGRELVSLLCNIDHADISNMRRQIFESMNNSFNRYKYSNSDDFTTSPSLFFPNYPVPSSDSIHLSTTTPSRSVTSTTAKGRVSIRRDVRKV